MRGTYSEERGTISMMLFAVPGLGSVSGVVHLAVRRPYITALAVAVLAAVAFTRLMTPSMPAFPPPPVFAAPVVQHTPRPSVVHPEHVGWQTLGHGQNPAAKQRATVKQRRVV
jgi:hypothetical protein